MKEDFEFVRDYIVFKIGDTVREPYTGYIGKVSNVATNHLGETVYFLEDIAGYFVKEELELIKEKEL
jgi:hypothetical protein